MLNIYFFPRTILLFIDIFLKTSKGKKKIYWVNVTLVSIHYIQEKISFESSKNIFIIPFSLNSFSDLKSDFKC